MKRTVIQQSDFVFNENIIIYVGSVLLGHPENMGRRQLIPLFYLKRLYFCFRSRQVLK